MELKNDILKGLVRQVRFRLICLLWLRGFVRSTGGLLFVFGVLILGYKIFNPLPAGTFLYGLPAIILIAVTRAICDIRRVPDKQKFIALIDEINSAGGLVMAQSACDIGEWNGNVQSLRLPSIRWSAGRGLLLMAMAGFFAWGCFKIEPRHLTPQAYQARLDVKADVDKITRQIETLEKLKVVKKEQAAEMKESLRRTAEAASGQDPAKTFKSLDDLANAVQNNADKAAEEMLAKMQTLEKTKALSQALSQCGGELSSDKLSKSMKELEKLAKQSELGDKSLEEQLSEMAKSGELSPEAATAMQKLAEACQNAQQCEGAQMSQLAQSGLCDLANLGEMLEGCEIDPDELAEMLANMAEDGEPCDLLSLCMGGQCNGEGEGQCNGPDGDGDPGRGGISRGRGDAEMRWEKDPADPSGAKFKKQTLPPSVAADKKNVLMKVTAGDPTAKEREAATYGGLNDSAAGGGEAFKQKILPRHRQTIKNYFGR